MTNNIDRAAEVIFLARIDAPRSVAPEDFIARRLADAGLLAADRLEYGLTFADESTVYWLGDDRDTAERVREAWMNRGDKVGRLVCRRVSAPWEVTDE